MFFSYKYKLLFLLIFTVFNTINISNEDFLLAIFSKFYYMFVAIGRPMKLNNSLIDSLNQIKVRAGLSKTIKLGEIFEILAGRGYAALLILLSFPFCLPIQIPGFSTPFGLLLSFLGLRIAFARHLWWPRWILKKELSSDNVKKLTEKLIQFFQNNKFIILRSRWIFLSKNALFHRLNGILIFFLGAFLSLPLPIPLTNLFSAVPILCIGLGLLEDDGLFILIAYLIAALGIAIFLFLFLWGKSYFSAMQN